MKEQPEKKITYRNSLSAITCSEHSCKYEVFQRDTKHPKIRYLRPSILCCISDKNHSRTNLGIFALAVQDQETSITTFNNKC